MGWFDPNRLVGEEGRRVKDDDAAGVPHGARESAG